MYVCMCLYVSVRACYICLNSCKSVWGPVVLASLCCFLLCLFRLLCPSVFAELGRGAKLQVLQRSGA